MENKSKEGRENGRENDTNDTTKGENSQAADNEVAKKCEEERDTENGVAPNASDVIETDGCQGPEELSLLSISTSQPILAVSGAKTTSEKPSGTVSSGNGSVQPKTDPEFQEKTRGEDTKAELKGLNDEAQTSTEDNTISQGKTDQTNASNSEKQTDPGSSQADPGTDQVETSGTEQYHDGGPPQTAADSPTELEGNKAIKAPSNKTPDAPTAQYIRRNNMEESLSNGTQESLPGSGAEEHQEAGQTSNGDSVKSTSKSVQDTTTGSDTLTDNRKSSPSGAEEQQEAGQTSNCDRVKSPSKSVQATTTTGSDTLTDNQKSSPSGAEEQQEAGQTSNCDSVESPTKSVQATTTTGSDTLTDNRKSSASGAEEQQEAGQTSNCDSVKLPTKSVQATTTTGSDTLTDNRKSSASDEEPKNKNQISDGEEDEQFHDAQTTILDNTKASPNHEHRDPTMNPPTPGRNSGSKDPKDKEGPLARERKATEESEEDKGAMEQKFNEKGAAATEDGTKEDGPTKQKANEKKVEAGGTEHSAEDAEEPFEPISKKRPVSISVCTSAYDSNVQGLVSFLEDLMKGHPELIKEVKVHALPYNDLDHYEFPKENPVDVMLLCHSINNRRFAITNVMDALYDEYLPYCARVVGKNKMGVIVHDFDDMRETVQSSRMGSFKYKQPKAFETTSLQITCGHIEKKEQVLKQMQKADREKLLEFLENASYLPEEMTEQVTESQGRSQKALRSIGESGTPVGRSSDTTPEGTSVDPSEAELNDHGTIRNAKAQDGKTKRLANERETSSQQAKRACLPKKGTPGGSRQTPQASVDERNKNPPREASLIVQQMPGTSDAAAAAHTQGSLGQQSMAQSFEGTVTSVLQMSHTTPLPRRISISVCSSAYDHNVKGFMSKLTELQTKQPHMIADVLFRSLPYNDIDSFRFPSIDPVDVMVLCHSVQNRGFSITNVVNALYEKYLQYCHDVIGKKKLAVIVHDFSDCKPKTLDVRMESFRRSQPLTFELVDTVIVCGSLEVPGKIVMRDEDMTRLTIFFEEARFKPKEKTADKKSVVGKLLGQFGF